MALAGLPLFALLAGFGGVEPVTLLAVAAALLMPLFALASATLLASVWCRQTRDAILTLYVLGTLGGLAVWHFRGPLSCLNPLYVVEPAWGALEGPGPGRAGPASARVGGVLGHVRRRLPGAGDLAVAARLPQRTGRRATADRALVQCLARLRAG